MKLLATICIATYAAAYNLSQHTCVLAQTHEDTEVQTSVQTSDDSKTTCHHYCFGKNCGWDCLDGDNDLVGSCVNGELYGGGDCDGLCDVNN